MEDRQRLFRAFLVSLTAVLGLSVGWLTTDWVTVRAEHSRQREFVGVIDGSVGIIEGWVIQDPKPNGTPQPTVPPAGTPPKLTDVQRLKILNAAQQVEIWQLKIQQGVAAMKDAREALDTLLKEAAVPGWELNLTTLEYQKPVPPK